MAYEYILYEKIDKVAKITMNRPEVRNAENYGMNREIFAAIAEAENDDDVRAIILAGASSSFSAGHDMGSPVAVAERESLPQHKGGSYGSYLREESRWIIPMLALRDMSKPIIAQVQGYCIMGGCMLATMCDFIVASEDAQFSERASRQGGYSTEFFSYVYELGAKKAKEYLMTGDFFSAEEAHRLGMVNKVVPREKLEETTMAFAQKLALQSAYSLKFIKQAVNYVQDLMGYRQAVRFGFNIHSLTHSHRAIDPEALDPLAGARQEPGERMSARQHFEERDAKFKELDKKW